MSATNPKDSSRIRGDARARREQRRDEALARQGAYSSLPIEARIEALAKKPGACKKERARLLAAIEQRGKVAKKGQTNG